MTNHSMQLRLACVVVTVMLLLAGVGCVDSGKKEETASQETGAVKFVPDYEGVTELNFGIISTESQDSLRKEWDPFLEDMAAALRVPVRAFFASEYAGVIQAIQYSKVQVAWFGNKSAVEAVLQSEGMVEVFAQMVGEGRDPGYNSLLITHVDSQLNSVEDVVKKGPELVFGNGDVNSTSGNLIPTSQIWAPRLIDPEKYFKEMRRASHGANIQAVLNKQVDFSTNNTEQMRDLKNEDPEGYKKIKILWKSPVITKDPIVYRKDLPRELKSAIQGFFLGYGRLGTDAEIARQREILKVIGGGLDPFFTSSNKQLYPFFKLKFTVLEDNKERFAEVDELDELIEKY
ncbi:MAG: phosphate/phosphite/phosphonate ABC transporter substrate-binding protein [Spirochaetales bacterium]|nr:phosphate/phosphite/phosphonate ABC transporter substrate-binding protein [Spirochaetales bacterium]